MVKTKAFTLIEMLVVIGIVAVLLAMGVTMLITMRNRTLAKQTADEFVQNYNTVRNFARNSVLQRDANASESEILAQADALDYYALKFADETYYQGTCEDVGSNQLDCTFSQGGMKAKKNEVIKVTPATGTAAGQECSAIRFNLSTGKVSFGSINTTDDLAVSDSIKECTLDFSHSTTPSIKITVVVDENGELSIQQ